MRSPYVQIRVPVEIADRIDKLRPAVQSRNSWVVRTLLDRVEAQEGILYDPDAGL